TGDATEAGGTANGTPGSNATGNVLSNDTDVDSVANGETKQVSAVNGVTGNVGNAVTGTHGSVTINSDGSYTYVINNTDAAVQALNVGSTITDSFNYTVKDAAGLTDTTNLTTTIHGADDAPVANNDAGTATEAGSNATGNVVLGDANGGVADTDVDNTTASLVVSAIRTGAVEGSGTPGTLGSGLAGAHGTLTIGSDG